jgi:glyoxylase-like metal-dependent hydrolase (beta-lactamase superfamily II)
VLPRITPHLGPESVTPWTGLDHYLLSLEKIRRLAGVTLALPGHGQPIRDLEQRIIEMREFHHARLDRVREICREPRTLAQVSRELFGEQREYGRVLALEETAAHIEYLARRGWLEIVDAAALPRAPEPVVRYRAAPRSDETIESL